MDSIQVQASKLWDLLFSEDTADTYQKTLNLTGTILKESAQLIWLIICSVFVFGAWFSDTSIKTGKGIRDWVDNQGAGGTEESKPIAETGKELLDTGLTGVNYLLNQAREQLGLEAQELPAKKPAAVSAKSSAPTPSAPPAAKTTPAPTKSYSATSTPSSASAPTADSEITREPAEDGWGSGDEDA